MVFDYIAKGLSTATQLPLNAKTYFATRVQLQDLGVANAAAYTYYEYMKVLVAETGEYFIWQEVAQTYTGGLLPSNFQYAANTISNNIDYSGRYFNFVPEAAAVNVSAIGKPYVIFKDPNNPQDYLEINDVVTGHFSPTLFMTARYLGGPLTNPTSWAIIIEENPKLYT